MQLQMEGIGNQKIKYRDRSEVEFDTLSNYLLLAKKSISKFANGFYTGLAQKMLKDEDAVSSIANAIMMADWRYDSNYEGKNGAKKTKYSYRNQCAIWAIQTHVTSNYKKNKKNIKFLSLDHKHDHTDDENMSAYSYTVDSSAKTPDETIIKKEQDNQISELINKLLNLDCISDKQKNYIKLYYFENYTFDKIGKKYNLTREAVRQSMNKALDIIRTSIKDS